MEIPKSLEELVLAHANLVESGIEAFRAGDYATCIGKLNKAIDKDKENWKARLYLAMAYYRTDDIYTGAIHFRYLQSRCPDPDIRAKAENALQAMDRELKVTAENNFFERKNRDH